MRITLVIAALVALMMGSALGAGPPVRAKGVPAEPDATTRKLESYAQYAAHKYLSSGAGDYGSKGVYGGHGYGGYCKCGKKTGTYVDESKWWMKNKKFFYAPHYAPKHGGYRRLEGGGVEGEVDTAKYVLGRRLYGGGCLCHTNYHDKSYWWIKNEAHYYGYKHPGK